MRLRQFFVTISVSSAICGYLVCTTILSAKHEWHLSEVSSQPILRDTTSSIYHRYDFQIQHSVVTRFMIGQGHHPALARARFELFKAFCYPTMVHQTVQKFFWIVLIDPGISPDILQEMTFLLQMIPSQNAYLVLTNDTQWWSDGISPNDEKAEGYEMNLLSIAEEYQQERLVIRSGNTYNLLDTVQILNYESQLSKPRSGQFPPVIGSEGSFEQKLILVETLLDADDGLHRLAIEYMQKDILRRTYQQHQELQRSGTTPSLDKTWWILCVSEYLEWYNPDLFDISADEFAKKGISGGLVGRHKTPTECISAGFTRVGYLDLTRDPRKGFNFPRNSQNRHFQIHDILKPCQHDTQKHCYYRSLVNFPGAVRTRSVMSDNMSHLDPLASLRKKGKHMKLHINNSEKVWTMLANDFSITRDQALTLSQHLYKNREHILYKSENSECIPGFPCLVQNQKTITKLTNSIDKQSNRNQKKLEFNDTLQTLSKVRSTLKKVTKEASKTKLIQPKTIPLYETEKLYIKKRHQCIEAIRKRQMNLVGDIAASFNGTFRQKALLFGPAYHSNVGDHMITLGEVEFLSRLGVKIPEEIDECGQFWQDLIPDCEELTWWKKENFDANGTPVILHGGGNWGDIWPRNQHFRIRSLDTLLQKNFTILGMPQSLYYHNDTLKKMDAQQIEAILSSFKGTLTAQPTFLWRDQYSYDQAVVLYPSARNVLIPDIAFQIGPYNPQPVNDVNVVDVVLFLRDDRESLELSNRNPSSVRSILKSLVGAEKEMSTTFKIVDWNDRLGIFESDNILFTEIAIQLLSMGRVLVCDRLHASILAYLSGIPFVYFDQSYGKISKTLDVALGSAEGCLDGPKSNFARAMNLTQALDMAMKFLRHNTFR
ncbi:polysaccharide pyruvyl transferase [Nitzschia inconspicua]|uniref:Polysaccharide pyruvyl transferase n=1 Tax=Nitzschia inconspicua TaxID=303405 RepID=A0A9K3Q3N4_9STRA|nr:polysaccharide pyruvyl transferase [Nitzschia inconspicua]